jgi:hypothetical protein
MLLPLAGVLLLCLLWTIYWFVAAEFVRNRSSEERARLAAEGVTLACTEEAWGGYPFHFEFSCSSPRLKLAEQAELSSANLLLTALAYAPWQVVALLDGPSTFMAEGILPTRADHQRAIAAITLVGDQAFKLSAEIPALSVPGHGTAAKLLFHSRPSATGGTDVAISVTEVNYQPAGRPPLIIAQGDLQGSVLSERTLNIERIVLAQGTVRYWGSGAVSLDSAHRPSGKLDTQTNDLDGLLRILEPHLEMSDQQKAGLRAMLGLLGNEAKAPLISQDGALYLGPFKIAEVPPLY